MIEGMIIAAYAVSADGVTSTSVQNILFAIERLKKTPSQRQKNTDCWVTTFWAHRLQLPLTY